MRVSLTTGQTVEIKTENAQQFNMALISGEVNYRIGDGNFDDATDDKLNEDVRTDVILIGSPTSIFVKAISASVIQYRRE